MDKPPTTTVSLTLEQIDALLDGLNKRDSGLIVAARIGGPAQAGQAKGQLQRSQQLAAQLIEARRGIAG